MVYRIAIEDRTWDVHNFEQLRLQFLDRTSESFTCRIAIDMDWHGRRPKSFRALNISRVRLIKKKDYCGQHAGPCQINPFFNKKHNHTCFLEWNDWVSFHNIINDVLDEHGLSANITTQPAERIVDLPNGKAARFFWIRKGLKRRFNYETTAVEWLRNGLARYATTNSDIYFCVGPKCELHNAVVAAH